LSFSLQLPACLGLPRSSEDRQGRTVPGQARLLRSQPLRSASCERPASLFLLISFPGRA